MSNQEPQQSAKLKEIRKRNEFLVTQETLKGTQSSTFSVFLQQNENLKVLSKTSQITTPLSNVSSLQYISINTNQNHTRDSYNTTNNTTETLSASPMEISSLADAQMQSFARTLASHRTKRDEEFYNRFKEANYNTQATSTLTTTSPKADYLVLLRRRRSDKRCYLSRLEFLIENEQFLLKMRKLGGNKKGVNKLEDGNLNKQQKKYSDNLEGISEISCNESQLYSNESLNSELFDDDDLYLDQNDQVQQFKKELFTTDLNKIIVFKNTNMNWFGKKKATRRKTFISVKKYNLNVFTQENQKEFLSKSRKRSEVLVKNQTLKDLLKIANKYIDQMVTEQQELQQQQQKEAKQKLKQKKMKKDLN